jgi:hypothetical protein
MLKSRLKRDTTGSPSEFAGAAADVKRAWRATAASRKPENRRRNPVK